MSRRQGDTKATRPLVVTTLRVDAEKLEQFAEIAATRHRSISGEMRWLMDRHIEQHTQPLEEAA